MMAIVDRNSAEHALLEGIYEAALERGESDIYITWWLGEGGWARVYRRMDNTLLWQVTGAPPAEALLSSLRREVCDFEVA